MFRPHPLLAIKTLNKIAFIFYFVAEISFHKYVCEKREKEMTCGANYKYLVKKFCLFLWNRRIVNNLQVKGWIFSMFFFFMRQFHCLYTKLLTYNTHKSGTWDLRALCVWEFEKIGYDTGTRLKNLRRHVTVGFCGHERDKTWSCRH